MHLQKTTVEAQKKKHFTQLGCVETVGPKI